MTARKQKGGARPPNPQTVPAPDQLVYTAEEARKLLRIGTGIMTRLLMSGDLPSIRLGSRRRLITRQALEDFLARMATTGKDTAA